MMRTKVPLVCCILLSIFLLIPGFSQGQSPIPHNLFSSPLEIPLKVAGTFGELRGNHFHSGLDLKTEGRQGLNVKAAAPGFISRIKVSADGFGKVLYVNHPEGFTTVYAHLYCFNNAIQHFVDSLQTTQEKFEVEFFPDSTLFPIQRGEIIGLSGSSGGSEAPHLHFEIRDRKTEIPMNPFFAGLQIVDTISPTIEKLFCYVFADRNWEREKVIDINSNNHTLPIDTFFTSINKIGFGVFAIDSDSASTNGIYKASIFKNDSLIFTYSFDQFSFDESYNLNAHIDYDWQQLKGEKIHRLFRLPGDSCSIYLQDHDGSFEIQDTGIVLFKIVVEDFSKNKDSVFIVAKRSTNKEFIPKPILIDRSKPFMTDLSGFSGNIPAYALYQDAKVIAKVLMLKKKDKRLLTEPVGFSSDEPLKKSATYQLKVPKKWWKYHDKLFFVNVFEDGTLGSVSAAKWKDGSVSMQSKNLGFYSLVVDTIPPAFIGMDSIADPVINKMQWRFRLKDDYSGIRNFNLFVDGHWKVADYNSAMTIYIVNPVTEIGPHEIRLTYSDKAGNFATTKIGY